MDMHAYIDQPTSQRQATVYLRTFERQLPSQPLQPYLNARPVLTKYTVLPMVDYRKPVSVPLLQQATFTPETIFNPGTDKGPWSGYATNVHHESELRNQTHALQCHNQAIYVPSSKSDLYNYHWNNKNRTIVQQPFPQLFQPQEFSPVNANPNSDKIGFALFNNATRQQTKDLTKPTTV
jgi:hypothetical protein